MRPTIHEPAEVLRVRRVLWANAAFTAVSATVLLLAAGAVDELLDLGRPGLVRAAGVALALFAADVAWLSRTTSVPRLRTGTRLVAAADAAWVVGSIGVLLAGVLPVGGAVAVGLVGLVVGELAWAEFRSAKALPGPAPDPEAEAAVVGLA